MELFSTLFLVVDRNSIISFDSLLVNYFCSLTFSKFSVICGIDETCTKIVIGCMSISTGVERSCSIELGCCFDKNQPLTRKKQKRNDC